MLSNINSISENWTIDNINKKEQKIQKIISGNEYKNNNLFNK